MNLQYIFLMNYYNTVNEIPERNRKLMSDKYVKWVEEEESYVLETAKKLQMKKKNSSPAVAATVNNTTNSFRDLAID